jgi:hypothetical protein
LKSGLNANLLPLEAQWGRDPQEDTVSARFKGLIRRAYEKTGKQVVVLIDEYDKPLLQNMDDPAAEKEMREELQSFYGVLKAADHWLRFVLLTGVTKFSKVNVFSDLNHLQDISMVEEYAGLCGISVQELIENFEPELKALAEKNSMTFDAVIKEMQKLYNGYHFCENGEGMFNPFSVLNTLANKKMDYYWFETGTPTFLIQQLHDLHFDLQEFAKGVSVSTQALTNYRADSGNIVPILYQSGYLTIKSFDKETKLYTLCFPNEEVKYGFLENLMAYYLPKTQDNQGFFIGNFFADLRDGNVDAFMNRLKAFIGAIPYSVKEESEKYYQGLFYVIFTLLGQLVQVEIQSAQGRADAVVITKDTVFVFEFKLSKNGSDSKALDALRQIDDKGYLIPYTAAGRKLVKIGAVFNAAKRTLGEWKAVTV